MSLPSASGSMPHASETAAPPLLPPHVLVRSQGLSVVPKIGLKVCAPAPNSGVLVLPMVMPPAAWIRSTSSESRAGTRSLNTGDPNVVRIPRVGCRSLCAIGRPCSGPAKRSRAASSSSARARSAACSATSVTIALTAGLIRSICARWAESTSRADSSLARRRRAISTALSLQISDVMNEGSRQSSGCSTR